MRKFGIFLLLIFMTLLFSQTFWYFENRVYCSIDDNNVTISLKKESWSSKCEAYINAIYQLSLKRYNEISAIRSYISQWDDVYYRKEILDKKESEFLRLVNYRTQIKTAIDRFETAFFEEYYDDLHQSMQDYYLELENQYFVLLSSSWSKTSESSIKITQLEQQMWNVSHVLKAKNMDDIMKVFSSYIYLKHKIEWK